MLLHDYFRDLVGKEIVRKTSRGDVGPFVITSVDKMGIHYRVRDFESIIPWDSESGLKLYRIVDGED